MFLLPQLHINYSQKFEAEYKEEQKEIAQNLKHPLAVETQNRNSEKNLENGTMGVLNAPENETQNLTGSRILKNVFKDFQINYQQMDISFDVKVRASFENGRQILSRNVAFGVPTSINKVNIIFYQWPDHWDSCLI